MPYYRAPRSDKARANFLAQALQTGHRDLSRKRTYINNQELLDTIEYFLPEFKTAMTELRTCLTTRSQRIEQRAQTFARLETYLRDFWEVLKRRVARRDYPSSVLTVYGLPEDGTIPKPTTQETWLTITMQAIQGDAQAVAVGYPPMANPSAEAVRAVLETATRASAEVAAAVRACDKAQAHLDALREQADTLIYDVMATLRFTCRKYPLEEQRRIMRTYGAHFYYRQGEAPTYDIADED